MLVLSFSSKLYWDSLIVSTAKQPPNILKPWFVPWTLLLLRLPFYKSTIWHCMEYCFHVFTGAPSCYFDIWDKHVGYVGLLLLHLVPLTQISQLRFFYGSYFGRCSTELDEPVGKQKRQWSKTSESTHCTQNQQFLKFCMMRWHLCNQKYIAIGNTYWSPNGSV